MAIKRYTADADNTITNAFKENLNTRGTGSNMGASPLLEVFSIYAQATTSSVEKARFRNPVIPNCKLELKIEAIRSHGRVWKYKGEAFVEGKKMADAQWSATIVDRK